MSAEAAASLDQVTNNISNTLERWQENLKHEKDIQEMEAQLSELLENTPLSGCNGKAAYLCGAGIIAIIIAAYDAAICGIEEDCQSSQKTTAATPTLTPTNAPRSCIPYIQCPTPSPTITRTPTSIPTLAPTFTPTLTPPIRMPTIPLTIWERRLKLKGLY